MEPDKTTLIDAQTQFNGKLKGKDARILGRFQGEIELSGRLVTGEGSRVEAKLKAEAAEIAGEFIGEISVKSLILLEKARTQGTFDAQTLAVREGAQMSGAVAAGANKQTSVQPTPQSAPAPEGNKSA